jgi:hypothetical protein
MFTRRYAKPQRYRSVSIASTSFGSNSDDEFLSSANSPTSHSSSSSPLSPIQTSALSAEFASQLAINPYFIHSNGQENDSVIRESISALPPRTPVLSACPPTPMLLPSTPLPNPQLSSSAPDSVPSFLLERSIPYASRRSSTSIKRSSSGLPELPSAKRAGISLLTQSSTTSAVVEMPVRAPPSIQAVLSRRQSRDETRLNEEIADAKETEPSSGSPRSLLTSALSSSVPRILTERRAKRGLDDSRVTILLDNSMRYENNAHSNHKRHEPVRAMARLGRISDLLHTLCPFSYLILDLDETVYLGLYQPCAMMKERGLLRYQQLLGSPEYSHLSFQEKSRLTRALQAAVASKRPVEKDTISTIQALQARGVPIFALTARYSSMADVTRRELAELGLNFSATSPFPAGRQWRDRETDALYCDGLIFTNANEKGLVLNRFLSSVLFAAHLESDPDNLMFANVLDFPKSTLNNSKNRTVVRPATNSTPIFPSSSAYSSAGRSSPIPIPNSKHYHHSTFLTQESTDTSYATDDNWNTVVFKTSKKLRTKKLRSRESFVDYGDSADLPPLSPTNNEFLPRLPTRLVFVDDRMQNCVSVMNGLRVADILRIAVVTYHYTPISDMDVAESTRDRDVASVSFLDEFAYELDEDALSDFQIRHFIETSEVLRDNHARQLHASKLNQIIQNQAETAKVSVSTWSSIVSTPVQLEHTRSKDSTSSLTVKNTTMTAL